MSSLKQVPLDILPLGSLLLLMWLIFNSPLFHVCSFTKDITVSSKTCLLFLSLTPPLVQATTQTHLNDCHHFPASLPSKTDAHPLTTGWIFLKWEVYQTHTQSTSWNPYTQTHPGIPDSSGPDTIPHDPPSSFFTASHIALMFLPSRPVFPYRALRAWC